MACLAFHTERRLSDEARTALDLILRRETRDEWALGYEVARLVGAEPVRGFFTFYARYDLAFVLELASRCGASREDGRVADLACFIEDRRGEFGLWEHPAHPRLSRWLTLELLLSLRRLETGDWSGSDLRMPFRPYAPRRDRH